MNEIKIRVPEGHVIDQENSDLAEGKIVFKKAKPVAWRKTTHRIAGFYVTDCSAIREVTRINACLNTTSAHKNIFAKKKQAQSMVAMAQLSQIIANDSRFGGPITDDEWQADVSVDKYIIRRVSNRLDCNMYWGNWHFLAFHTAEQRDLFLQENEDLIKQYYMID